jgi:hypothetical protein
MALAVPIARNVMGGLSPLPYSLSAIRNFAGAEARSGKWESFCGTAEAMPCYKATE